MNRAPQSHVRKGPSAVSGRPAQDVLLARVKAARASLKTIPLGDVDALVLPGPRRARIVTLQTGDTAYQMLVEAMSEGAAILSRDGMLLYGNRRFSELLGRPVAKLVGRSLGSLLEKSDRERIPAFLRAGRKTIAKGEFFLRTNNGLPVPVHLSLNPLRGYRGHALGIVITDLTEQRKKQEEQMRQTAAIHRLLLERELQAQEKERRHIARELHDEAGQLLTSLLVALRALEAARDLKDCRQIGKRMRHVTAKALDEVGRLARGLHPIALDDHGLEAALTRYVAEYSKTHKIRIHLKLDRLDLKRLPPPVQLALYRVLQETLTNVARHARARNVRVEFNHTPKALQLSVTDDGRGFNTSAVSLGAPSHLGLRSIRERMALLGGTATFVSGRKGTQVLLEIPLDNWELPDLGRRPPD
jgi:PAS domain S-box-containing protein